MSLHVHTTTDGKRHYNASHAWLVEQGVTTAEAGRALKTVALNNVGQWADSYRAQLASTSAGKLAAYRFKEEIALDPDNADPAELALIDREATARGMARADLIDLIRTQASAYRQAALLVEVLEAEAKAEIAEIADVNRDIETAIANTLTTAKEQAEIAFSEALALINGGS